MGLTRISTRKGEFVIEINGRSAAFTKEDITARVGKEAQIKAEIEGKLGRALGIPIFFHRNRDGTLAVATGRAPEMWPEDEAEAKTR